MAAWLAQLVGAPGIGGGFESHHLINARRNEDRWAEKGKQGRGKGALLEGWSVRRVSMNHDDTEQCDIRRTKSSARTLGEYILLPERIKKGMSPTPEEDPLRESDIGGRDEGG